VSSRPPQTEFEAEWQDFNIADCYSLAAVLTRSSSSYKRTSASKTWLVRSWVRFTPTHSPDPPASEPLHRTSSRRRCRSSGRLFIVDARRFCIANKRHRGKPSARTVATSPGRLLNSVQRRSTRPAAAAADERLGGACEPETTRKIRMAGGQADGV